MSGTTAWVLTAQPGKGAAIWRFPTNGAGTLAVGHDELAALNQSTIAIASRPGGFIVTGERCDSSGAGECSSDSGIVQLRGEKGNLVSKVTLWHDQPTEAGGNTPGFLGLDGTDMWIQGLHDAVKIDDTGKVLARVPLHAPGTLCFQDGGLYRVSTNSGSAQTDSGDASGQSSKPHSIGAGELATLPPATLTVDRWAGSDWTSVKGGTLTGVGASPDVSCHAGSLIVLDAGDVAAAWKAPGRWVKPPASAAPLSAKGQLNGPMTPTIADDGAVYRLGDDFALRRFDLTTGKLVDTGLKLQPTTATAKTVVSSAVAESGPNLFACASASGLPGGPSKPGTVCGFAPIPS